MLNISIVMGWCYTGLPPPPTPPTPVRREFARRKQDIQDADLHPYSFIYV